jgi:hypothetical protein
MPTRRRPGLRRLLRLVADLQTDLVEALADDGRVDVGEAAHAALGLVGHLAATEPGGLLVLWGPRAAAWRDLRHAARKGNREQAHAALDRALGWT